MLEKNPKFILSSLMRISILILNLTYLVLILIPYSYPDVKDRPFPNDVMNYFTGASILKSGRVKDIYNRETQVEYQQRLEKPHDFEGLLAFRTPPTTAYLYLPLLKVAFPTAFHISLILNALLFAATIFLAYKVTEKHGSDFLNTVIFLPTSYALWHCLANFQLGIVITFITMLSIYLIKMKMFLISGIVIGLVMLKPSLIPVALVPFLLTIRHRELKHMYSFLLGLFATAVIFIIVNTTIYGMKFLPEYIHFLAESENNNHGTVIEANYNIVYILYFITKDGAQAKTLGILISAILLIVLSFYSANKISKNKDISIISGFLILIPILNIHTMPNDLVLWVIPLLLTKMSLLESSVLLLTTHLGIWGYQYITVIVAGIVGVKKTLKSR